MGRRRKGESGEREGESGRERRRERQRESSREWQEREKVCGRESGTKREIKGWRWSKRERWKEKIGKG